MNGSVTMTDLEAVGGRNGARQVVLGLGDGVLESEATGAEGGDGGRQRAAGAVGVLRIDAARCIATGFFPVYQDVDALFAAAMPALDEDGLGALSEERAALLGHGVLVGRD